MQHILAESQKYQFKHDKNNKDEDTSSNISQNTFLLYVLQLAEGQS